MELPLEEHSDRLYFTIGEVASMLQVNASLLRFWEKEFGFEPKKNSRGTRIYTRDDLKKLQQIYHLVKEKGMTLSGARAYLEKGGDAVAAKLETVLVLKELRTFLLDLKSKLD